MRTERKHFVTFLSPGTFFAESTTKPIADWDPREAMKLAGDIVERHGATPFGFRFATRIVADDVPDGEGGTLKVEPKTIAESGTFYINGVVETLAQVEARATDEDRILVGNMKCNGYDRVVTTRNGYRSTRPFEKGDCVVDSAGNVTVKA